MKNFAKWLGVIAFVAVIGFSFVTCKLDDDGGMDSSLNGTWINNYVDWEFKYNNGNFENSTISNGTPASKGTYTTDNGKMTSKTTHLWGKGVYLTSYQLDAKWYTKAELQSFNIGSLETLMQDAYTVTYSISGNTLTFSGGAVFTRK